MSTVNIELIGRRFVDASGSADGATLKLVDVYRLESLADVHKMTPFFQQRIGFAVLYDPVFFLESWSFGRVGESELGDGLTLDVELNLKAPASNSNRELDIEGDDITENTPPWLYRLDNWRVSSATEETSAALFYPTGKNVSAPFVNTAGVPLEATTTRGLIETSFDYNVRTFNISACADYVGTVNAYPVIVGGITFAARTLRMDSLDASEETIDASDGSVLWRYVKISVKMTIDPTTWNRDFLNVGNAVASSSGPTKIWRWTDSSGVNVFGSYANGLASGAEDLEESTEPMFLTAAGTNISPFDASGRQYPTYLSGCLARPMDWAPLCLPAVK